LTMRGRARVATVLLVAAGLLATAVAWNLSTDVPNGIVQRRFSVLENPFQSYATYRGRNVAGIVEAVQAFPLGAGLGRSGGAAAQFGAAEQLLPGFNSGAINAETYVGAMVGE